MPGHYVVLYLGGAGGRWSTTERGSTMSVPDPKAMSSYYAVPVYDTAPPDAPSSNPAFPEKRFRGSGKVQVWDGSDTAPALEIITIPPEQNDVNFPGVRPKYPAWVPNPTVAVGNTPGGLSSATIASWLATEDQAKLFATLIAGTTYVEAFAGVINFGSETRRVYQLTYPNGLKQFAGDLITAEFSGGVGRPGHWDVSSGTPLWVSDPLPSGAVAPGPAVGIPLDLKGGTLVSVAVGPGIFVVEVKPAGNTTTTASGMIGNQKFTLTLEGQ
jgi:hypothetical protein